MEKKYCIECGKELVGQQIKFCSQNCKAKWFYKNKGKFNPNAAYRQFIKSCKRKIELINYKGGKCEACGYDKNIAALDFHHIDPSTKEFQIDGRALGNYSYDKLKKEADKCALLCANCHRELHYPDHETSLLNEYINKEVKDILKEKKEVKRCKKCGKKLFSDNITGLCKKCLFEERKKEKEYPTLEEVNKCYEDLHSWEKVAKNFGITRRIIQGIRNKK